MLWGNCFKFGINVHLDPLMTWLDFGGRRSNSKSIQVRSNLILMAPIHNKIYLMALTMGRPGGASRQEGPGLRSWVGAVLSACSPFVGSLQVTVWMWGFRGCSCLNGSPAMNWRLVLGVPNLSPNVSWIGSSPHPATLHQICGESWWMDGQQHVT